MERHEKHNERHRRYQARHREQEEERNRELENLHFYGVMLDSCFTAVAFYEMARIYRDRSEACLEDTVNLLEILRVLNLQ